MPRHLPEEKRELTKRLILAGDLTVRDIANRAQVSVGTVTRMRSDLGLFSDRMGGRPRAQPVQGGDESREKLADLGTNPNPSAAALRLAEFDPVVARAVIRKEEPEDGE